MKKKHLGGGTVYRLARKVGRKTEWFQDPGDGWQSHEKQGSVFNERPDANEDGGTDEFVVEYRMLRLTSEKKNRTRTR